MTARRNAVCSFLPVLQPSSVLPHLNQPYSFETHWQTTKIFQVLIIHSLKIFIYSPSVPRQIHGEPFRFITCHWSLRRSLSDPLKSLVKGTPYLARPLLFRLNSVRQTLVRLSNNWQWKSVFNNHLYSLEEPFYNYKSPKKWHKHLLHIRTILHQSGWQSWFAVHWFMMLM